MTGTGAGRSTLRYYFSLRSPYSWLAHRELRGPLRELSDRLEWIPFWEPDEWSAKLLTAAGGEFVYSPMSRAKHFYILQDVRRLARRSGLEMTWPVDREPCWEVPHLAYLAARAEGVGLDFIDRAYRARWEQGLNICDREVVAAIGADLGMDPAVLRDAADDPERRDEGVDALLSIHRDGVFGVPFLITGFDKYWGIDRLEDFVSAVHDAEPALARPTGARPADPPRAVAGAAETMEPSRRLLAHTADAGHAGGCG